MVPQKSGSAVVLTCFNFVTARGVHVGLRNLHRTSGKEYLVTLWCRILMADLKITMPFRPYCIVDNVSLLTYWNLPSFQSTCPCQVVLMHIGKDFILTPSPEMWSNSCTVWNLHWNCRLPNCKPTNNGQNDSRRYGTRDSHESTCASPFACSVPIENNLVKIG